MELQSNEINEIAKALSLAQSVLGSTELDGKNPHFKSSYSTLQACISVTREPLAKNGLAFTQQMATYDNKPYLVSTLTHISGQWLRSYSQLILEKPTCQGMGAAITYMRRYSLCAMLGLFQEDDDGQKAEPAKKANVINLAKTDELSEEDMEFIKTWSDYFTPDVFNSYLNACVNKKGRTRSQCIAKYKEDVEIFKRNVQSYCDGLSKTS